MLSSTMSATRRSQPAIRPALATVELGVSEELYFHWWHSLAPGNTYPAGHQGMATSRKTSSLYSRLQSYGTLTESPRDVPDARFALPSTIHWMRALAILTVDQKLDFAAARGFYAKVQARNVPEPEFNTVCEQLLFVLNQIAALQALASASNKADVARTAIVVWYYGVYSAASAMTAAMDAPFRTITPRPRRSGTSVFRPEPWPCLHLRTAFQASSPARSRPS